jgi:hypothetical protein
MVFRAMLASEVSSPLALRQRQAKVLHRPHAAVQPVTDEPCGLVVPLREQEVGDSSAASPG